jgi:hypothetical protein
MEVSVTRDWDSETLDSNACGRFAAASDFPTRRRICGAVGGS